MVELIKEERKVEIVGDKIHIHLTAVEKYDAEEFLRVLARTEAEIEHIKMESEQQCKQREQALKQLKPSKGIVQKIRDAEIAKAKEERDNEASNSKNK